MVQQIERVKAARLLKISRLGAGKSDPNRGRRYSISKGAIGVVSGRSILEDHKLVTFEYPSPIGHVTGDVPNKWLEPA